MSAATGATGVGVASKFAQAGALTKTLAGAGVDAVSSVATSVATKTNITAAGVATDVLTGVVGGAAAGKVLPASTGSVDPNLQHAADRANTLTKK